VREREEARPSNPGRNRQGAATNLGKPGGGGGRTVLPGMRNLLPAPIGRPFHPTPHGSAALLLAGFLTGAAGAVSRFVFETAARTAPREVIPALLSQRAEIHGPPLQRDADVVLDLQPLIEQCYRSGG